MNSMKTKTLRLSNLPIRYEKLLLNVLTGSDINTWYFFDTTLDEKAQLDDYDTLWFTVTSSFTSENYPTVFSRLESYSGRKVNFNCTAFLRLDQQINGFIKAGFALPPFQIYEKGTLPEEFDCPMIVRASLEYSQYCFSKLVVSRDDVNRWLHWVNYDYILQDFSEDTFCDGLYYNGQIYCVGDDLIPRSVRWSNQWYVSPTTRGIPHLGLVMGDFNQIPNITTCGNFEDKVRECFNSLSVDIGCLDFSISENGDLIPWGITAPFYPFLEGEKNLSLGLPFPTHGEQLQPQICAWNAVLNLLGSNKGLSPNELFRPIYHGKFIFE